MNDDIIRHEDRYYIAADSTYADERAWSLNHADTFGVFDRWGDIQPLGAAVQGVYHRDTRYLSQMQLRLEGRRPVLLSSTVREENEVLSVDLTNPEIQLADGARLPKGAIHLHRNQFVRMGAHYGEIVLQNFDVVPRGFELTLALDADFRDIFEVRGTPRARRGELLALERGADSLGFGYRGLDGLVRRTRFRFEPGPAAFLERTACFRVRLEAGATLALSYAAAFQEGTASARIKRRATALGAIELELKARRSRIAEIGTDNENFNQWLRRSRTDLVSLVADTAHGPYPYAGVPWYNTAFGRDGILTALSMLWLAPDIARGVLEHLAATQATESDAFRDAEPGKIFHELRGGEMATLNEVPFARYYGSVDATPLFLVLAGAYYRRTDDRATIERLWPHLEAALGWIEHSGDLDGDGFVEYQRRDENGLFNQGWKDSHDAISHEDGALADAPIALCEVQGYVYAAWRAAADLARALGRFEFAAGLDARADALRQRFDRAFWDEALQGYVLALDRDKRPCRVRSSNAGQCLWTGIAYPERAPVLARMLLARDMFSGWGVRTLSSEASRYNPMSYHNGTVWPHDNALIALGLSRYGQPDAALQILRAMFDASLYLSLQRLPELFCGFPRRRNEGPTAYPVACAPQAWSVAAVFMLLEACLSLDIDAPARSVRIRRSVLPPSIRHVHLSGFRLGDGACELDFTRHRDDVGVTVARKTPGWEIVVEK